MKNIWLILILLILLTGCGNKKLEEETNQIVINSSYSVIYNNLDDLIDEIKMFPTKEREEEFIYYIKAIKDNHTKFSNDELISINNLLNFEYYFNSNEIDYSIDDYNNDRQFLINCIQK